MNGTKLKTANTDINETPEIKEFLLWEMASRSTIDFKVVYVDVAGDLIAGLLLSQIVYWNLPDKSGNRTKLRVFKHDRFWLAKGREDWYEECRITAKQFDRAVSILEKVGVVECKLMRFSGSPTKHIWLNIPTLHRKIKEALESACSHDFTQRSKSRLPKGQNPDSPLGKIQIDEKGNSLTEITYSENSSEINAHRARHSFAVIMNNQESEILDGDKHEAELRDRDRANSNSKTPNQDLNQEPESRSNRLASLSKDKGTYSTTVKAAKKERMPRAGDAKSQPHPADTLSFDKDGWMQLPCKSKEFPRHKLPATIALRRMQYKIAFAFLGKYFEPSQDDDAEWWIEDFLNSRTISLEEFEEEQPIGKLIDLASSSSDRVKSDYQLTQDWFNDELYEYYLAAIAFCEENGSKARPKSRSVPPFILWGDLAVF